MPHSNVEFSNFNYCFAFLSKSFDIYYASESFYSFFSIETDDDFLIYKKLFKKHINNNNHLLTKLRPESADQIFYIIKKADLFGRKVNIMFAIDFSYYQILQNSINNLEEDVLLNTSILNSLQDGVFITDEKGKTLYVNDSFTTLSGLEYSEVVGHNVFDLLKKKIVPNSCCAKVIETKMSASTINKYYTGKECLVSGIPTFNTQGELRKVVSIIRDLSELQNLKLELEKTTSLSLIYKKRIKALEATNLTKHIVTKSKKMQEIFEVIPNIANLNATILILGETGVGKDFLANYIHTESNRKDKGPFLKINCCAIPEHLLESELFGYESGSFTGANKNGKAGLLELANNGTLFLDEIGDIPYNLQVKLLAMLQDKTIYRLGGDKAISINSRIIAATNADLEKLIKEKQFRIDLYYRLNVINFTLPPLRERREDIIYLANIFLKDFNSKYNKNRYFSSQLYKALLDYHWPGNIREMKNIIERLVIMAKNDLIDHDIFYSHILGTKKPNLCSEDPEHFMLSNQTSDFRSNLQKYEECLLKEALEKGNTLQSTADYLNITLSTLVRRKRKYNL